MPKEKFYNYVDKIIAYESGDLSSNEILEFFGQLIKGKMLNTLQGSYQRTAQDLIERGYISAKGKILKTF